MTRVSEIQAAVTALDEQGKSVDEIAAATGLSVDRVEQVLAHVDDSPPPPPPAPPIEIGPDCGSPAGARVHYARREKPCGPCHAAMVAVADQRRAARAARSS